MDRLASFLRVFWRGRSGGSATEYALLLAIAGAGILTAAFFLGGAVATAINDASSCLMAGSVTC
jgi:Flp pilus assembly pilin Flp